MRRFDDDSKDDYENNRKRIKTNRRELEKVEDEIEDMRQENRYEWDIHDERHFDKLNARRDELKERIDYLESRGESIYQHEKYDEHGEEGDDEGYEYDKYTSEPLTPVANNDDDAHWHCLICYKEFNNKIKCPRCGSTQRSLGPVQYHYPNQGKTLKMWGFFALSITMGILSQMILHFPYGLSVGIFSWFVLPWLIWKFWFHRKKIISSNL